MPDSKSLEVKDSLPTQDFWVPGNTAQSIQAFISHETLKTKEFLSLINYSHFNNRKVLLHLIGNFHDIIVPAWPLPSTAREIVCRCSLELISNLKDKFVVAHIIVDEGKSVAIVPTDHIPLSHNHLIIPITHEPYRVTRRKAHRYVADNIQARVLVDGMEFKGKLIEFSTDGCHIAIAPGQDLPAIGSLIREIVLITFTSGREISLKKAARIVRAWKTNEGIGLVASPIEDTAIRFSKREVRNPRVALDPPPIIRFVHPLSGRVMELEAHEIGFSGFSVLEPEMEGALIPGLFIRDLKISIPGSPSINCSAQVIYKSLQQEGGKWRVGISIVDIGIQNYTRLSKIISRVLDPHVRMSGDFNSEALWELFFSTSFIYPDKYAYIHPIKEEFKETHHKICSLDPEIAKSFVYQKGGVIYAHMGLVRAFEKSWMLHHHAARAKNIRLGGLIVLKNAMYFLNDMHRYPSSNMKYAICFFRPSNRFPRYVFGGFAQYLKHEKGCSTFQFSYQHFQPKKEGFSLPKGWTIEPMEDHQADFIQNNCTNPAFSLLLHSLGMFSSLEDTMALEAGYARYGMIRRVTRRVLCYRGEPQAILVINRSDPGLNFSGLLDCVYLIVMPHAVDNVTPDVARKSVDIACSSYPYPFVPVISYPAKLIPSTKSYTYWALDVAYGDEFMLYMKEKFKIREV